MKKYYMSGEISAKDYDILSKYGFDFNRNISEYLKSVAHELRNAEKLEKASKGDPFKQVTAVYTGGNIWLFYGELKSGEYFLTDDYGSTLILNENPSNLDESLYPDWQEEHKIEELFDNKRITFCNRLANRLLRHDGNDDDGGITDDEIRAYKKYWPDPISEKM